jgi:hypothetical protein
MAAPARHLPRACLGSRRADRRLPPLPALHHHAVARCAVRPLPVRLRPLRVAWRDQGCSRRAPDGYAHKTRVTGRNFLAPAKAGNLPAERRLGQIMAEQATVGLAKGGAETGVGRRGNAGPSATRIDAPPTLAEAGIDKHLAATPRNLPARRCRPFQAIYMCAATHRQPTAATTCVRLSARGRRYCLCLPGPS